MSNYELHPRARAELLEAGRRYRAEAASVAQDFQSEVRWAVNFILTYPEASPLVRPKGIRRRVLRKFPYSLYYSIKPDLILILAVAHQSRRPGYWVNRL